MGQEKKGHLTPQQYTVLKHRAEGKSQEETAKLLGTTRKNISLIERRARRKYRESRGDHQSLQGADESYFYHH